MRGLSVHWAHAAFVYVRRSLRNSGPGLTVACAALGALVGLVVVVLHETVTILHDLAFAASPTLAVPKVLLVPAAGGLALGLLRLVLARLRAREVVDPIEANAIHGGRMSLADSLRLTATTAISNIAGASVGMEAAYSQLGAGLLSWFGQFARLRRRDLRIFVGAGAAAAISAAFNAPLAGAFYAFELVIGTYNTATLAQIAAASMAGDLVVRGLTSIDPIFNVHGIIPVADWQYLLFATLGIAAAPLAVLTMRAVRFSETLFKRLVPPGWLRPALGGAAVTLIAILFPQVLGSGQGLIQAQLDHHSSLPVVALLLVAKISASALSIGSGFRGGLFSSALLIGCLFGELAAGLMALAVPVAAGLDTALMVVGMGAVAAGIIGAPVTMVLLALEMTGSFPISLGVFVGVVLASAIVRHTFGFSFSTWRFHLRGLPITGAEDVGWLAELTVGKVMRAGPRVVAASTPLARLRDAVPPGSAKAVFVVGEDGRYCGWIDAVLIHDRDLDDCAAGIIAADLAGGRQHYLLPNHDLRHALGRFTEWMVEALPVLASATDRRPVGVLTEPYALRRYSRELETRAGAAIPPDALE
jgi:chloride channel protein, CIC family